jgi:acetyl esterase/lipase
MSEARWRARFRAVVLTLPQWARDAPERMVYTSNASGVREVWYAHQYEAPPRQPSDRPSELPVEIAPHMKQVDEAIRRGAIVVPISVRLYQPLHGQITDRPNGTTQARLDPSGAWIWWFDDQDGSEHGRWMLQGFPLPGESASDPRPATPSLPAAYSTGLALGHNLAVVGLSEPDRYAVYAQRNGEAPRVLYQHEQPAFVGGLSRDESLVALSHSEHGNARYRALRVLDLDGNARGDRWDGPDRGLYPLSWSPVRGDQRLLVMHERGDIPRPLIWSPGAGEEHDIVTDLPGEVTAAWYPDASALLLTHDLRGRSELYRYVIGSGTLVRLETEPGTISGAAVRPDGRVWYTFSSGAVPPDVLIQGGRQMVPRHFSTSHFSTSLGAGDEAPPGVPYVEHEVNGIPVLLAEPPGPRPHPTIFWIHGGPSSHDRDQYSPRVQAWVDHGYAVVHVNYRGSTGFGRPWRDAIVGNPGFTELADIAAVHDWALAQGIAEPGRSVLAGGSWGGYLTLLGLGMQPHRWALGIAVVPVGDTIACYEDSMPPLQASDRALFGGSPEEIPEAYRARSPITYVQEVRVPVMILAGENDPRCPIRQVEMYVRRLEALEKPHEVLRFDAGHGSLVVDQTIAQTEAMLSFTARHLNTPPPV